ncbi:MAG: DUF362 domain-containing protein [Myxococcota bacterium]|nr:DUF362 domain-containing protein [Myxococcota bacterium]
MSLVSIQRCARYEPTLVNDAVEHLLAPFGGFGGASGFDRRIRSGDRVLIKPNFLRAAPPEAAVSPHPELLRAVSVRLLDLGVQLRIGDSPAFGTARGVAQASGALDVAEELGIPVVEFRKPIAVLTEGSVQLKLQIDREVIESDAVINLCKFKGHQQLGMTLAVKNLFGCITGKRKPIWHLRLGDRGNGFGEMLVEVYRHVAPTISICDGVVAMQGDGPGRGEPRPLGLLLAAEDGVALDAVGAAIVGYPPEQLRVLQAADRLGLGCTDLSKIELAGDIGLEEARIEDWKFPDSLPIFFNPGRVAWSTAKQALLLAKMKSVGT